MLTDSKIYFASHFDSKIGALDRVTKKLIWDYDFQKEEGAEPRIMELQGNENLLGALVLKELYIFLKAKKIPRLLYFLLRSYSRFFKYVSKCKNLFRRWFKIQAQRI